MRQISTFLGRNYFVFFVAIVVSILISFWVAYSGETLNTDAICYLLSADEVGQTGIRGAMQLCGQAHWPFYSVILYSFTQLSHLVNPYAAYVLNSIFSLTSVLFFILIVKTLGGSNRILWLAALTILCAHEFNAVRTYIIRDHGFWAFYLGSIFFLLNYFNKEKKRYALAWSASLFTATLFRIEGLIFLICIPFFAFFYVPFTLTKRIKIFLWLNILTIGLGIIIWFQFHQHFINNWGRLSDLIQQFQHFSSLISDRYTHTKAVIANDLLSQFSRGQAGLVFIITLLVWYVISVITNLSIIYTFLLGYALKQKAALFNTPSKFVLSIYIILNVGITLSFLYINLFLSKRYLIALSLVLMLWVPFALNDLLKSKLFSHKFLLVSFVGFFILIGGLTSIINFGYSKAYLRSAGHWLALNVPKEANLYTNDNILMYYSDHFGKSIFVTHQRFAKLDRVAEEGFDKYDYVALRINKDKKASSEKVLKAFDGLTPLHIFSNKRGDQVIIYQLKTKVQI